MVWNVEASRTVAVVCEFPWSSFVHCAATGAGPPPSHATMNSDSNLVSMYRYSFHYRPKLERGSILPSFLCLHDHNPEWGESQI